MEMDMRLFISKMKKLLPGADPAALRSLACCALEAEWDGDWSKEDYLLETYTEFVLIVRCHGQEIAHRLLEVCQAFALDPSELRGAANHLCRGVEPNRIGPLALDGKCGRTESELLESEKALEKTEKSLWRIPAGAAL